METNGDAEAQEHEAIDEQEGGGEGGEEGGQDETTEAEAVEVKTEPQEVEMKDYAADTMNELLGIYGYDGMDKSLTENLQLQHFASEDQERESPALSGRAAEDTTPGASKKSEENSPNKTTDTRGQSVEEQIVCAWCKSSGSKRYTLNTAVASQAFCSENCFAAFRRSYFTRTRSCAHCQKVCLAAEMHKVHHKEVRLFFCSPKCVAVHSSDMAGKDRDTKLKKMLQRRYANDIQQSTSNGINSTEEVQRAPSVEGSSKARYPSDHRIKRVQEKRLQKSFTMDDILNSHPSGVRSGVDCAQPGSSEGNSRSRSHQQRTLNTHKVGHEFESLKTEKGVFLPPPTVMVPYPVFVPVPCPIPVPIPVSSKAFKMAQRTAAFTERTPAPSSHHQPSTSRSIPNRQNLFPSAFYPVTRTSLPESVPGSSTGPAGYPPLAALPPEGVFHHGSLKYQNFLPVPDRTSLNQFVRLRGLQRSASMDLPVCHYPSPNSLSMLRSPQTTASTVQSQASTDGSSHSEGETRELSKTVKEALRSHLSKRLSQSALNLTEVGRFPDSSDDLKRSHSLSRLPVRSMESVPETEPSTSSSYSTSNKRKRVEQRWQNSSPSENGSVQYKRKRDHRYLD